MTTILVAEDEPDMRQLIALVLRFGGFEVEEAIDGIDVIEKARELRPDLILMDDAMPRMLGVEACRRLKQMDITKGIPVVFLSARGRIADALQAGAIEFFSKPFDTEQLPGRIAEILAGTRLGIY